MQRFAQCTAVLVLSACAAQTATTDSTPVTQERVIISDTDGEVSQLMLTRTDPGARVVIPAARDEVWRLLPGVYTALGLPAPDVDPAQWVAAVQGHTLRSTLGRQRLATFIECGRTMTGDRADEDRIRLSVWTWVEGGTGSSSTIRSRVEATATSVEGRSGSIPCSSRGELESRIAAALRNLAGR